MEDFSHLWKTRLIQGRWAFVHLRLCIVSKCHISFLYFQISHFWLKWTVPQCSVLSFTHKQTGKHWRRERKALQCLPSAAFAVVPFVAHILSTHHPPSPCRAHTWAGWIERLENCSGSEWKLCWLIRGAAQATPSLFEQLAPCCRVRKVTLRSKLILGLPFVSSWNLPALLFSLTLTYPITMHNGIWIFNEETHSSSYNSLMFRASRGGTDHCISCYISLKVLFLSDR